MKELVIAVLLFSVISATSCLAIPRDLSDRNGYDGLQGLKDCASKRSDIGFSQGAGYDSRNKLKELLRKKQQQQKTQSEYLNRWNERFEEEFGKRSRGPARSKAWLQNRY